MCGIVGAVAKRDVKKILLDGLKYLEYRGYDSAGLALLNEQGELFRERVLGKVNDLIFAVKNQPHLSGEIGIAHTRWATHGAPSESNAHPLVSHEEVAVVHNGIIENHEQFREKLTAQGIQFTSDTDTEVIVHLIHQQIKLGSDLLEAVMTTVKKLIGAFSLAVIAKKNPQQMIVVRHGSPLLIGLGKDEHYVASDSLALLAYTQRFINLEEGDIADITVEAVQIYDKEGLPVTRSEMQVIGEEAADVNCGKYRHYMQKEIFEQANAIRSTLEGRLSDHFVQEESFGPRFVELLSKTESVHIIACGTSYHAGLTAKYWIESIARVQCQVEVASEFRYRNPVVIPGTLFVAISQSGETADTLAAIKLARTLGYVGVVTICNVENSAMVRDSDVVLLTKAGREIGVASTKAFTTQLTVLLLFTVLLARRHGLSESQESELVKELKSLPYRIEDVLRLDESIRILAQRFSDKVHALYLGRGAHYPIAMEGALKIKEVSYIHAEAYAAGELKHGPLALVDKSMPIVVVIPHDDLVTKLKSNLHEVQARGGELIVFADEKSGITQNDAAYVIHLPETPSVIAPIVFTVPLQLLAYHVALLKGTDVDQPRNLAKSVTVE